MRFFRVDKRDFDAGHPIVSAKEFMEKGPVNTPTVEDAFEAARPPALPCRTDCLYVFENLEDAKKHWSKMTGSKLYEVQVMPHDILHRADMSLVDLVGWNLLNPAVVQGLVGCYWAGECGVDSIVEVLVKAARVSAILSTDERERENYRNSWMLAPPAGRLWR